MNDNDDKLLDGYEGIGEHFGIPSRTVEHWATSHGLPVLRVGRRIYGRIEAIKEWMDRREGRADG